MWVLDKVEALIDLLRAAFGWIGKVFGSGGASKGTGAVGKGIDPAGHMAAGGTAMRGGLSWVGERGPELLNLPSGAEVRPLGRGGGNIFVTVHVAGRCMMHGQD